MGLAELHDVADVARADAQRLGRDDGVLGGDQSVAAGQHEVAEARRDAVRHARDAFDAGGGEQVHPLLKVGDEDAAPSGARAMNGWSSQVTASRSLSAWSSISMIEYSIMLPAVGARMAACRMVCFSSSRERRRVRRSASSSGRSAGRSSRFSLDHASLLGLVSKGHATSLGRRPARSVPAEARRPA